MNKVNNCLRLCQRPRSADHDRLEETKLPLSVNIWIFFVLAMYYVQRCGIRNFREICILQVLDLQVLKRWNKAHCFRSKNWSWIKLSCSVGLIEIEMSSSYDLESVGVDVAPRNDSNRVTLIQIQIMAAELEIMVCCNKICRLFLFFFIKYQLIKSIIVWRAHKYK